MGLCKGSVAFASWDKTTWGPEYLSLAVGDRIAILADPDEPQGWLYGENVASRERGWFPPEFIFPSLCTDPTGPGGRWVDVGGARFFADGCVVPQPSIAYTVQQRLLQVPSHHPSFWLLLQQSYAC